MLQHERILWKFSYRVRNRLEIARWIQIVPEVKPQRTDGCPISQPHSEGVRGVVVAAAIEVGEALRNGCAVGLQAQRRVRLVPAQKALQHIVGGGEYVAHIMKNSKGKSLSQVRQGHGGEA